MFGIAIEKVGLVPVEITFLGITLRNEDQNALIIILAIVIAYFFVAFLIYGITDYMVLRKKHQEYLEAVDAHCENMTEEDQFHYDEMQARIGGISWIYQCSTHVMYVRAVFEYLLPILVGIYAVVSLLFSTST
jgi:hypothetical protein